MPESATLSVPPSVREAFDLMWEDFPLTVHLLRSDRTILMTNRKGRERGGAPGGRCFELAGRTAICPHCRADLALEDGSPQSWSGLSRNKFFYAYWLPLPGHDGLYVHLAVDITAHARLELGETS